MKAELGRSAGRPKGSSRLNGPDTLLLEHIADLLADGRADTPTAAMHLIGISDDSARRRLRKKWSLGKEHFLSTVQERKNARKVARINDFMSTIERGAQFLKSLGDTARKAAEWIERNPNTIAAKMVRDPGYNPFQYAPTKYDNTEKCRVIDVTPKIQSNRLKDMI